MKLVMLRNLGRGVVSDLKLAEAYAEGCVCDLPDELGNELVKRGLAVSRDEPVRPKVAPKPVEAK